MSNPARTEKLYWARLAGIVGCIACRIDGRINNQVSIHHIDGRTKPGAHSNVLPLCAEHHQTGGEDAPAIHPWKRRFEAKYGAQSQLKAMCDQILFNDGASGPAWSEESRPLTHAVTQQRTGCEDAE